MERSQIKPAQRVSQIDHPEYGQWIIKEHYSEDMWNIQGARGTICTSGAELEKFWKVSE